MKKVVSTLLVTILLLTSIPVLAFATDEFLDNIESIEVAKLPNNITLVTGKDSYTNTYYNCSYDEYGNEIVTEYEYEQFSVYTEGMQIKVNFADGTSEITDDMDYYQNIGFGFTGQAYGETWDVGKHKIIVNLGDKETFFEVEVIENPVESIEIAQIPDNTTLVIGKDSSTNTYYDYSYDDYGNEIVTEYEYEDFSISTEGLKVKVNFTDGTSEIVDDLWDYMDSYFDITGQIYGEVWDIGTHTVTVSFYDCETTFEVEVIENPVESIEIAQIPDNTTLVIGKDSSTNTYYDYSYDDYGNEIVTEYEYEDFYISTEGLKVKVNFTDGTSEIVDDLWDYMDSYFDITGQTYGEVWDIGTHTVTVSFYDCEATFEVEVVENPVESIEVYKLPDKTTLVTGVDSYVNFYDDYSYDEDGNEIITKKYYNDFSIPREGMKIKVNFTDGTSEITDDVWDYMDSSFDITGQDYGEDWTVGSHQVTVSFYGKETTFDVNVMEGPVEGIEIVSEPKITTLIVGYHNFTNVPIEGLKVRINYVDGNSETVDIIYNGYPYNNSHFNITAAEYGEEWNSGKHNVFVSFCGQVTSYQVDVVDNPVSELEFVSLPLKEEYLDCEWVDLTGAKVKVYFNDGTDKIVTITEDDYVDEFGDWHFDSGVTDGTQWTLNLIEEGHTAKKYEFKYREHSIYFSVNITNRHIEKVEVLTEPDFPNGVGAFIKIKYSDNSFEETQVLNFDSRLGIIDDGLDCECGFVKTESGIYKGFYAFENLFDVEKTFFRFGLGMDDYDENSTPYLDFNKIFALKRTDELAWTLGGRYNWTFSLDENWFDGKLTEDNIDAMLFTARDFVGYQFGVTYENREISGDVAKDMLAQIFDIENIDLSLSKNYDIKKDLYTFAEPDGGWGGGFVDNEYNVSTYNGGYYIEKFIDDYSLNMRNNYYAFFEADGRCSYFNSTPKNFASLEIESLPTKTEYFVGDEVDLSGLKLKYTDEESREIIIETGFDANITILDLTEIENITVTYSGLTVEIPVTVKPLVLTKIAVNTLPNKLYYNCGETFDSTGLKLLLTYNSGKTEIIDSGFVCIPELLSVAGNQVIAVTYSNLTTTFTVNVSENVNVTNGRVNSVSASNMELNYKSSATLNPQISADAGVKYTVTYSSSNPSVASVDANGKVSTGKTGSATITVTVTDEYGNTVKDTCEVKVSYNWWQWIIVIVLFGWIWY